MIELRDDRPKFGQVTVQPPDFNDCNHGFHIPVSPASPAHGIDSAPASASRLPMRPLPFLRFRLCIPHPYLPTYSSQGSCGARGGERVSSMRIRGESEQNKRTREMVNWATRGHAQSLMIQRLRVRPAGQNRFPKINVL